MEHVEERKKLAAACFGHVHAPHGAPMGRRREICEDSQENLSVVKSRWTDYDYDQGGAYWGGQIDNGRHRSHIWCGVSDNLKTKIYVRAKTLGGAKREIKQVLPDATFKN